MFCSFDAIANTFRLEKEMASILKDLAELETPERKQILER